jgi:hypothetical protein
MGFRSTRFAFVITVLASGHSTLIGQETPNRNSEQNRVEREIKTNLTLALDRDYGNQPADDLLMLAIQHSDVAVPELKRRLSAYNQQSRKKLEGNPAVHADALAYVANTSAVDALSDLCNENPRLFCPYLERTLDYAEGRSNPFTLAYRAAARRETIVQGAAAHWVNSRIGFAHFQQRLGEAMLDRYGRVPGDLEWATDPIASRLKDQGSSQLRSNILRFATQAQNKRGLR